MSLSEKNPEEKVPGHTTVLDTDFIESHTPDNAASDADEKGKIPSVKETAVSSDGEDSYDLASDEFADIPELVRNIVSFEDDSTLPVITFRSVLLSVVFCVLGSFVSQLA